MKSQGSIEIDAPIEVVFDMAMNHVPEWSSVVIEDEMIHETPERVGSTFRCVTSDHGRRMNFDGLVTRYDEPTGATIEMRGKQFDIRADYQLEDLGGRVRVTQDASVEGKGLFKLLFALTGWMMKRRSCDALQVELASLKALSEARAADAHPPSA